MKSIRHCRIEREIVFSNKKVINVAVENPTLLRLLLEELENPDDTSSYAFHFYSDDKELLFEKNCVFIKDCFCLEMDEKKIAAFIQKDIASRISEEDQKRIFERFYRVDKSHSKAIGGTGLGLSIVKHGTMFLGADMKVESTLGEGSRFILTLPEDE